MNRDNIYELLFNAVKTGKIQEVQKAASRIFGSAVSVVDSSFKVLSADIDPGSTEDMLEKGSEHTYVSKKLMNSLREHNLVHRLNNEKHKVILVNWGFFKDYPHITTGIYSNSKILGSIVVLVGSDQITKQQEDALIACADALSLVMQSNEDGRKTAGLDKDLYSSRLFNNTILPEDISHLFDSKFFTCSDRYTVMATDLVPSHEWEQYLSNSAHNLIYISNGIFYVLSGANQESVLTFQKWIEERGYRYGISYSFNDLTMTNIMASQACAALNLGNKSGKNQTKWNYSELALQHIVESIPSNTNPFHPAIAEIRKYDQINNTNYFHTLKSWLENSMDYVATAESLHVHRNSLYYRMNRIQEIFDIDLSNMDLIVQLYLSILSNRIR